MAARTRKSVFETLDKIEEVFGGAAACRFAEELGIRNAGVIGSILQGRNDDPSDKGAFIPNSERHVKRVNRENDWIHDWFEDRHPGFPIESASLLE